MRTKTPKTKKVIRLDEEFALPESDPDEETLQSIVEQFGPGDVLIKVYKQEQGGRSYCSFFSNPADLNAGAEEAVRALGYGAGRYILHVIINGEFRKAINVNIADKLGGGVAVSKDDTVTKLLLDRLGTLEQRLLQSSERDREPISALADAMLKLNQLNSAQTGIRELPIDTIMKCIELGKSLNKDGSESWMDIIKEAVPMLGQVLAHQAQQPRVLAAGGNPPAKEENMEIVERMLLKRGTAYLKKRCLAGVDPGLYLELIITDREEPQFATLIHRVLNNPFSTFAEVDPEISTQPFEPFFRTIFDGLRSAFATVHPVDANIGRTPGNPADAQSNGTSGKGRGKK